MDPFEGVLSFHRDRKKTVLLFIFVFFFVTKKGPFFVLRFNRVRCLPSIEWAFVRRLKVRATKNDRRRHVVFYRVLFFFLFFSFYTQLQMSFRQWSEHGFHSLIGYLLGFTGFYWVLLGFTGFYWVLLGFTGFDWV